MKRIAVIMACALALGGCFDVTIAPAGTDPATGELRCTAMSDDTPSGMLVIQAQAVPAASAVPCLRMVPFRWVLSSFDVRDGRAVFALTYAPQDTLKLTVNLDPTCDTAGATESTSDHPGTRRFDRGSGSAAPVRYYVYPGACTTLRFALDGPGGTQLGEEIGESIGFVARADLDREIRRLSGGRLHLDPEDRR